ncbi:MAG: M42 family metallopeptidase [Planctomycetota bacterium]
MTTSANRELLQRLATAAGPPGAEEEVRAIVREALREVGEIRYDRLGSILCERRGSSATPRVVLDGHMDEVGFMVQSISSEGRLAFVALGGWWGHVLLGQRVDVMSERGGKIPGVIGCKPPHFLSPEERRQVLAVDQMYIDVGGSDREEVLELGIQVGDPVVPHTEFCELATPGLLSCKAFDDRVGVGLMCEALLGLKDHPNTVIGVGAVQEEVGCRGAGTATEISRPDVAIILEGTPADDLPGISERQGVLGGGPQIRFVDPTAISNRRLLRFVESVARRLEIPVQLAVRQSGGTDARSIHIYGSGVPTVVIGIPARYIHTHVSLIQWRDYENGRKLLLGLLARLDESTVAGFSDYSS